MSRERLLVYLVVVLTLINLAVLAVLFFRSNGGPPPPGPSHSDHEAVRHAIRSLDFDEEQAEVYKSSREIHKQQMKRLNGEIRELSRSFYHLGIGEEDQARRAELLIEIEQKNKEIYQANLQHFDDLRNICREDQLPRLEAFIDGLLRSMQGQRPPRKRGGK